MSQETPNSDAPDTVVINEAPSPAAGNNSTLAMVGFAVVAFLGVMLVAIYVKGPSSSSDKSEEAERLRTEIANLHSGSTLTTSASSATALLARIDTDVDTLRGIVSGFDSELASKNAQMAQMQSELASSRGTRETLTSDINRLRNELSQALAQSGDVASLKSQLENARALLDNSNEQLQALRAKPDLSSDLINSERLVEQQKARIADLESQLTGAVSGTEAARLRKELAEATAQIADLRAQLTQLRAQLDRSKLYVEDAANLAPLAASLFTELKGLEGSTPEQLRTSYERIRTDVNARRVELVAFATGSSEVDTGRYGRIAEEVVGANDESFFLVVGYASKSGDSTANRSLSANRATTVASIVNTAKKPNQRVQAVYLGETDRFSTDSLPRNQICEVWEITPR